MKIYKSIVVVLCLVPFFLYADDVLPQAEISPDPLNFGNILVNSSSTPQTVTIKNISSSYLPLYIFSTKLSDNLNFTKSSDNCSGSFLQTNESCTLTLTFTPLSDSNFISTLSVIDLGKEIVVFSTVEGTGVIPKVLLSTNEIDFGDETIDSFSAESKVIITNNGTSVLNFSDIDITGEFELNNYCDDTLAPNKSCTLGIIFDPTDLGEHTGSVSIGDDALDSPQTISLSGNGVSKTEPDIHISELSVNFGSQPIETISDPYKITVTNTGTANLIIQSISESSDNFEQTNNCVGTITSKESCEINIVFQPTNVEDYTATITLIDNATDSPQNIELSGIGFDPGGPQIDISTNSIDFGEQEIDTLSDYQDITLLNAGTESATISNVELIGDIHSFTLSNDCDSKSLEPNQTCKISVAFIPVVTGDISASILITNSTINTEQNVSLTGIGIQTSDGGCSIIDGKNSCSNLIFLFFSLIFLFKRKFLTH